MSRALLQSSVGIVPLILTAVLLSVLWAAPGLAHSGHASHATSMPAVGSPTSQLGKVARADTLPDANSVFRSALLSSKAWPISPGVARQVVWAMSVDVLTCGPACGKSCADCDCGSCLGTCSSGNACSAACASMHGAIVSQGMNAFGNFEVVRFFRPSADRMSGRALSPEPPPPKA